MMNKIRIILLTTIIAGLSYAGVFIHSGLDLLSYGQHWNNYFSKQNTEDVDWSSVTYFQAYVSGVASAKRNDLNTPAGAQVDQLCNISFQYLKQHPNKLHKPAADLIVEALKEAFPATKNEPRE